jgi:hypothetical protein
MSQHAVIRDPLNPRMAIVDGNGATGLIIAPEGADPNDLSLYERPIETDPRGIIY